MNNVVPEHILGKHTLIGIRHLLFYVDNETSMRVVEWDMCNNILPAIRRILNRSINNE